MLCRNVGMPIYAIEWPWKRGKEMKAKWKKACLFIHNLYHSSNGIILDLLSLLMMMIILWSECVFLCETWAFVKGLCSVRLLLRSVPQQRGQTISFQFMPFHIAISIWILFTSQISSFMNNLNRKSELWIYISVVYHHFVIVPGPDVGPLAKPKLFNHIFFLLLIKVNKLW